MAKLRLSRFWIVFGIILLTSMIHGSNYSNPVLVEGPVCDYYTSSTADAETAAVITTTALLGVRNILRQAYDRSVTELEITDHIDSILRTEGSDGELSFPTSVMTRDEFSWPYGLSNDDAEHIIHPSSEPVVTIRAGARVNGQCVDVYRTYFYESVTQQILDAYTAVLSTEVAVIDAIEPGVTAAELDHIVGTGLSGYIGQPNITYSAYWGHGLGDFVIVEPFLSYESPPTTLTEGQLLGIQIWLYHDDGWFVRVEDSVVVTSTGVEVLSDAPKQIEDLMIHPYSPAVQVTFDVENYDYGNETSISASISDDAYRSISSVEFFNGQSWLTMSKVSSSAYSLSYFLDYSYPSFVRGLLKVTLSNDTVYFVKDLSCNLEVDIIYQEMYDPPIKAIVEQTLEDGPFRYIIAKQDAEMIRLNFYNVYPPPGDQFLVRDAEENVIFEYKWNLGDSAVSPWVPGNIVYIDVISTWRSDFGGVNHFYFTVDFIWVFDTEATTSTTTTSTNSGTTTPSFTTTFTTVTTTGSPLVIDLTSVLVGGIFCVSVIIIGLFLRKH